MAPLAFLRGHGDLGERVRVTGPTLARSELETPIGRLVLFATGRGLCVAAFADGWMRRRRVLLRRFGAIEVAPAPLEAVDHLRAYFDGDLAALERIHVDPGGTPFQARVWRHLRRLPAGRTTTYGRLAARLGAPRSSRAVGAANGANPVAVVIPCHRLVGAGGDLTGYAFGVRRKRWLLRHEGVDGV